MSKTVSLRWLQLTLAVMLLFGGSLPAFAETQNLNGIQAAVEDETGQALNQAQVVLYEYQYVNYTGQEEGRIISPSQTYRTSVKNGKFFIPNAYLLKGNKYDLVVKGTSPSSNKEIVYHYSFTGGDISALNFSKDQLKALTFTHNQSDASGDFVLVAKNAYGYSTPYGNDYYSSYSYFKSKFDAVTKSVSVLMASNVELEAYAFLNDILTHKTYTLRKSVATQAFSGQSVPMDDDLVKVSHPGVTPFGGYVAIGVGTLSAIHAGTEAYVSRGLKGIAYFGVTDADWSYSFFRDNVTFTEDTYLQFEKQFQGSPQFVKGYNSQTQTEEIQIRPNFKDSLGNILSRVDRVADQQPALFEYELIDKNGKSNKLQSTSLIGIPFGKFPPGQYRLKLVSTNIPSTTVSLELDQSIGAEASVQKTIPIEVPQGYTLTNIANAAIWVQDPSGAHPIYTSANNSALNIDIKSITPTQQYALFVAASLMDSNNRPVTYIVNQSYTGQQLLNMQQVPVEEKLVKSEISTQGSRVQKIPQLVGKTSSRTLQADFTWWTQLMSSPTGPSKAYLLSEPGSYELRLGGTDLEGNGYNYSKQVSIPDQPAFSVHFEDLNDQLVPVELKNNGNLVPFNGFYIRSSGIDQYVIGEGGFNFNQSFNRIYTTPGTYNIHYMIEQTKPNETPWYYELESGFSSIQAPTVFSYTGVIGEPVLNEIQQYKVPNSPIYTSIAPEPNVGGGGGGGGGGPVGGFANQVVLFTSATAKSGDLRFLRAYVARDNGFNLSSRAQEVIQPYEGVFNQFVYLQGTATLTREDGTMAATRSIQELGNISVNFGDQAGNYLLNLNYPIGPKEALTISKPVTIGDPNSPPGKPAPVAAFAGLGLKLTWSAISGASYYDVYAAEQGQALVKIKGNVTGTSYTYAEAKAGKTYDLKVVAVNSKGSTESETIHFTVPEFAVSQLTVATSAIESSAGLLKIGGNLPIELAASTGAGISAKAVVSYKKLNSEELKTEEVALQLDQGKYTGTFQVKEGMTKIAAVRAYLVKEGTDIKSEEKQVDLNKNVGATLTGTIKQRNEAVTGNPVVEMIIDGRYMRVVADPSGSFTAAGLPKGTAIIHVIGSDRYTNVISGITTEFGSTQAGIVINLLTLQNVKLRLLEQGTDLAVAQSLRVSISGPASKEGYVGQDGYFVTYSGVSELKRLNPGTYTISVRGEGLYDSLTSTFTVNETTDYLGNPIVVHVNKKTKEIANVTLKVFMPEGTQTNQLESYYLHSSSASNAFGWEAGNLSGYNQHLTVSERVYAPYPHPGQGAVSVTQHVYGYYGTLTLPSIAAAPDYTVNVSVPGFQRVYLSQVSIVTGTPTLEVALQPAVFYTGRIVDTTGKPIAGAEVSASAGGTYAYARTDADGNYKLDRLAESNLLQVHVQAIGFTGYNGTQPVTDHQVPVIALENDHFIHGIVVDKESKPLKHVSVYASGSHTGGWARTDADGYFKIRGLVAGTYTFTANLYGYPSVTKNLATSAEQQSIVLQSQGGSFSGAGNSFTPSVTTVVYGKDVTYRLNYKNNGTSPAGNTVWNFELPSSVKLVDGSVEWGGKTVNVAVAGSLLQVSTGDVAAGDSGSISFKVSVERADDATIRTIAYPVINGHQEEPTQIATTSVLYVTLNAPAVTGDKKIKVYGTTKPGSIVEIFSGAISLGRVTAEGRWWYADVVLPAAADAAEAEFRLTAQVIENNHSQSSEAATVKYKAGVAGIDEVTITAGWNVDVKLNPKVSVATFAITEKTPIETKVMFKEAMDEASIAFLGSKITLTKSADGKTFTGRVPYGWSSYGEQMLTLTYVKNGVAVTVPLMEVIVLIDPSGYVFEGSLDNRLPGVTAVVQRYQGNTSQWSTWDADNYGQINPQTTDVEGRYGWDVLQGNWRVLFNKEGYVDYTSRTVVVPPAETQLNVPLVRTTAPKIDSITPADRSQDVGVSSSIDIVFDRPMAETGMNGDVIRLVKVQGGVETAVDVTFVYQHMKGYKEDVSLRNAQLLDSNNQSGWFIEDDSIQLTKKLTLKPTTALAKGTTYKVIVKGNLFDYSGSNVLNADSSYTFTTAATTITPTSPPAGGGGGGGGSSVLANEAELDFVVLSNSAVNNEVSVTLTTKQDTLVVKGNVWKAIQSKGYTVKLQHKDAVVTIPSQAFTLKEDETLVLSLLPTTVSYPSGYTASSQVLQVGIAKQKNGQKVELTATQPLELRLAATPSNEPELIGAYAIVDGKPQYLGRAIDIAITASGTFGLAQFERPFTDVGQHWAKQDIRYLVSHHIVDGVTDTAFEPSGTTTRGQIAKLFAEMLQLKKTDAKTSFMDVPADAWYADAVGAVEKAGIFQGADGLFRPDAAISRQELALVISRLVKTDAKASNEKGFADQEQIADWAQAGVRTAVKLGIIQGDDAGNFLPAANATRAEAAAMIHRLIKALDKQ